MRNHLRLFFIIFFFQCCFFMPMTFAQYDDDDDEISISKMSEGIVLKKDMDCGDPCTTLEQFFFKKNLDKLLQKNLYLRTNSVLSRSLLDLPIFQIRPKCQAGLYNFSLFPFFNQTAKMYFSKNSSSLSSYVNFGEEGFIGGIIDLLKDLNIEEADLDVILPLFTDITLQERRAGAYLSFDFIKDCWYFKVATPVYYLERNFFLTEDQTDAIAQAPFIRSFSAGANDTAVRSLLMEHLVSDKIALLGDIRLQALYEACLKDKLILRIGGFVTLPTAFALKSGIMGGPFCKSKKYPGANIEDIMETLCIISNKTSDSTLVRTFDLFDNLKQLAFNVLDSLSAKVVERPLSDGFNFGPTFELEYNLDDNLQFLSQFSVRGFAPRKEIRFFMNDLSAINFNKINSTFDPATCTPDIGRAIYAFYDQIFHDSLFPPPFKVKVYPGVITQLTSLLRYTNGCLDLFLGYDFWNQSKESIKFDKEKPKTPILFDQALNPAMTQHKFFGGFSFTTPYKCGDLHLGLRGDITFANRGIGKDFSLAFEFGYSF